MTEQAEAIVIDRRDELAVPEPTAVEPLNLFGATDPVEVIAQASRIATALKAVVDDKGLVTKISKKDYPHVEAWTLLGSMLGVFPVTVWTHQLDNGWEARVEAVTRAGDIVGAAEAQCTRSENTWKSRDDYALRAMAQTRAVSRAMRQPLGFVMVLAGYEATPEAEMPREAIGAIDAGVAWKDNTVIPVTKPARGGATAPQMSKLHVLAKELGWDDDRRHLEAGVESFTHLTKPQASELIERWTAWIDSAEGEAILGSSSGGGPRTEPSADTTESTSSGGGAHGESPAGSRAAKKATAPPEGPPNATQWERAEGLLGTKARILNLAHARYGITELEQLTKAQLAELIEHPK